MESLDSMNTVAVDKDNRDRGIEERNWEQRQRLASMDCKDIRRVDFELEDLEDLPLFGVPSLKIIRVVSPILFQESC